MLRCCLVSIGRGLPSKSHMQRWRALSAALEPQALADTKPNRGGASSNVANPLHHPDYFDVANMTSVRELLDAKVHLGHKTGCWNPLMKPYLHGSRSDVHIFDLDKTLAHLRRALNVAAHIAYRNGVILFVNERPQFERVTQATARDCREYFVTRWRGGTLTNSHMLLGTLRLPDLIVFLSVPPSKTAVKEAAMCNIPCVGIVDSDCNPNLITYPVPGNDDTPSSIKLYCRLFSEVIKRAKERRRRDHAPGTGRGGVTPLTPDILATLAMNK